MTDRIFTGLQLLSTGLRPYVTKRASAMSYGIQIIKDIEDGDAQFLLVLMWDHWNELYRTPALCDPQRSGCQYSELEPRIVESIVAS